MQESDNEFFNQAKKHFGEKEANKLMEQEKKDQEHDDISIETRKKEFEKIVEEHSKYASNLENSIYVKKIEEALEKRNIPVVRCDGKRATGVLNHLPNIKIERLKYKNTYMRYNLALEK